MQTIVKDKDVIEVTNAVHGSDASVKIADLLYTKGYKFGQCNITVNGICVEQDYVIKSGDDIVINKTEDHWSTVTVNGEKITLTDFKTPVFVDIFNFIDFNLTSAQGIVILKCNGEPAEYTQSLNDGDEIEVYWQDKK